MDYYDISEGVFNKFSENDYNKINAKVKLLVEEKALESDILSKADLQRDKLLDLFENMIEAMGYRLETKQTDYSKLQRLIPLILLDKNPFCRCDLIF